MINLINFIYSRYNKFFDKFLDKFPYLHRLLLSLTLRRFKNENGNFLGKIKNHDMYFSRDYLRFFLKDEYEPEVTEIFLNEIQEGSVIIDIGANIGYFSLLGASKVGDIGKVFAFEPEPNNYKLLVKNIKLNGYENVIPIEKAVSNENKSTKLFLGKDSSMNSLIQGDNENTTSDSVPVDTINLDTYFNDHPLKSKIKLIKMDIEGAEMMALLGMRNLIKENKELVIITEFNPEFIRNSGFEPADFLSKLKEHGFDYKVIFEKDSQEQEISDLSEIEDHVNLFCYKNSRY